QREKRGIVPVFPGGGTGCIDKGTAGRRWTEGERPLTVYAGEVAEGGRIPLVPKLRFGNALPRNSCFGWCSNSLTTRRFGRAAKQEFRGKASPNRSLGTRNLPPPLFSTKQFRPLFRPLSA